MNISMPAYIGSLVRQRPLALAEKAIDAAAVDSKSAKKKFSVSIDIAGRVWVDRPFNVPAKEHVATITRKSDPDWLEEELAHEWKQRNP
jgi:hypothetical protein